MNKEIKMVTINKIKHCLLKIFEAEDDDIPNHKIIGANNRAIMHYLKDYSKEQQEELFKLIKWTNDNCCVELEKTGWKVIREKNIKNNKITIKEFWSSNENLAIHCDTEEKANKLLKEFNKFGERWFSGVNYLVMNHWHIYEENTCYDNMNSYTSIDRYKANDYKIYEFEDINFEEKKENGK